MGKTTPKQNAHKPVPREIKQKSTSRGAYSRNEYENHQTITQNINLDARANRIDRKGWPDMLQVGR